MNESLPLHVSKRSAESAQAWFGLRLAASLTELQALKPRPDIDARLRLAREQALDTARRARLAAAPVVVGTAGGSAVFGGEPGSRTPWWLRLGSLLPLAVLLAGLVLIERHYTRSQIDVAAEIDAAILADDLPPEAYRDRGFVEFLKTARP
jgi:hypothetical protein